MRAVYLLLGILVATATLASADVLKPPPIIPPDSAVVDAVSQLGDWIGIFGAYGSASPATPTKLRQTHKTGTEYSAGIIVSPRVRGSKARSRYQLEFGGSWSNLPLKPDYYLNSTVFSLPHAQISGGNSRFASVFARLHLSPVWLGASAIPYLVIGAGAGRYWMRDMTIRDSNLVSQIDGYHRMTASATFGLGVHDNQHGRFGLFLEGDFTLAGILGHGITADRHYLNSSSTASLPDYLDAGSSRWRSFLSLRAGVIFRLHRGL